MKSLSNFTSKLTRALTPNLGRCSDHRLTSQVLMCTALLAMGTPSVLGEVVFGPGTYQRSTQGNQIGTSDGVYRVPIGAAAIFGEGTIIAPNDFTVLGGGTFLIELDIDVGKNFNALISGLALTGNVHVGGDLIVSSERLFLGGRMNVEGYAQLDGTLGLPIDIEPEPNARFTVLTAGKGVNGKFSGFNNPYPRQPGQLLYFDLKYEERGVYLEAVQNDFQNALSIFNLTGNQSATASALDGALFDPRQDPVLTYLDGFDISAIPGLLDQIAPEELGAIYSIGFARMNSTVSSLQNRFADIRSSRGNAFTLIKDMNSTTSSAKSTQEATVLTTPAQERFGSFTTASGDFSSSGDTGNAKGYDSDAGLLLTGFDGRISDPLTVGVIVGYARTESDLNNGGEIEVNGGSLALYAQYVRDDWFVESMVGGSFNSYDTERLALNGTASGDTEGGGFDAYLSLGKDLENGNLTVTPFASLLYTRVGIDGYDEKGSLQPLYIESQAVDSLSSRIGLRAAQTFLRGDAVITPYASAQWKHEYLDDASAVDYRFANGSGGTSTAYGPEIGRNSLVVSGGLQIAWERYACYLSYQADLGRENYENQTVLTGFRVSW